MADQFLLLINDVEDLGRSGEVVKVKPGFARNFLLPRKLGVIATKNALRMQERLKEERRKRAEIDRKESEKLAANLEGTVLSIDVKTDPEGHMYGSVSALDICHLLHQEKGAEIERKNVLLAHAIKATGIHQIKLRLKEEVTCTITLKVIPEGGVLPEEAAEATEAFVEEAPQE